MTAVGEKEGEWRSGPGAESRVSWKPTRSLAPYHRLLLGYIFYLPVAERRNNFRLPWLVIILLGCDSSSENFSFAHTHTHLHTHTL